MSDERPIDVELMILAEARNEVGAADHKASMVLAVLGIGFSVVLGGLVASEWSPAELNAFGLVTWVAGAALAVAAVVSAAWAVWPRFTLPAHVDEIFYWGHVATLATPAALDDLLDERPPHLSDRVRHQMFELSRIVARKYQCVRLAMRLAAISAPFFVAAGLWG